MYYLADIDSLEQEDNNLQLNDYYIFNEAFTEEECLKIIRENEESNQVSFTDSNFWIYDRLCNFAREANNNSWKFNINGISEPAILESFIERSSYSPKSDTARNFFDDRKQYSKISFHVCLSKEEDYEGGEHLIHNSGTPVYANKKLGTCLFFPSYMISGVTPLTKGTKYWLRGFFFGPHFK